MKHSSSRTIGWLNKAPEVTLVFGILKVAATTLGEAPGDAISMSMHLGDLLSTGIFAAIVVGVLLALVAEAYHWTSLSRTLLFWAACILTRPLGAVVGDAWTSR